MNVEVSLRELLSSNVNRIISPAKFKLDRHECSLQKKIIGAAYRGEARSLKLMISPNLTKSNPIMRPANKIECSLIEFM